MALLIVTDVLCDVCDTAWENGASGRRVLGKEARRNLARQGWRRMVLDKYRRVGDVCPDCVSEVLKSRSAEH